MTKQEIRKAVKELKSRLPATEIQAFSRFITKQVLQSPVYGQCSRLYSYVSFHQEVVTTNLLKTALYQQKKVAVPKITGREMKFFFIHSLEELKPGVLGILEPVSEEEAVPETEGKSLILVPGLAFDLNRNRIGYGKGYYDGFFMKYRDYPLIKIALAYDFQILNELPAEEHDVKVDQIITQSRIIK